MSLVLHLRSVHVNQSLWHISLSFTQFIEVRQIFLHTHRRTLSGEVIQYVVPKRNDPTYFFMQIAVPLFKPSPYLFISSC